MEDDRSIESGRRAPLAQVGLAALVAGTLLTFSALAFRTAFNEEGGSSSVAARPSVTETSEPVVLPAAEPRAATEVAEATPDSNDRVLGKRIGRSAPATTSASPDRAPVIKVDERRAAATDDRHGHKNGNGHEKARGRGHHKDDHDKWKQAAKEDDDESWDRDSDDGHDDWNDDHSQSHSGHNASHSGHSKSGKG